MRKIIKIVLAVILLFCLVACGSNYSGLSKSDKDTLKRVQKAQKKIIEICENYLDYDITADEAYNKLDSMDLPDGDLVNNKELRADIIYLRAEKGQLCYALVKGVSGSYDDFKYHYETIKKIKF